jgi:hypothetical protein
VTIRIYDVKGQFVHQLELSNQKAGSYLDKKTAAYWNGKDQLGQLVSSLRLAGSQRSLFLHAKGWWFCGYTKNGHSEVVTNR